MQKKKSLMIAGSICLILVFAALPFMAACAKPAPAPAPAPAPTPTPAPVPAPAPAPVPPKVWQFRYADMDPPHAPSSIRCIDAWCEMVEEVTKGRIKITRYHAETLAKGVDLWDAAKYGIADITWVFHGYRAGYTPLSDVIQLPFLGVPMGKGLGGPVLWTLYEKFPAVKTQFTDVKPLLHFASNYPYLATTAKAGQVKKLEDLKGLKIRCTGGPPVDMVKALGGVPVLLPSVDVYSALQKGVVDGIVLPVGFPSRFRLHELLRYYTQVSMVFTHFTNVMNWDSWNSLTPDVQKQMWSVCGRWGSMWYGYMWTDFEDAGFEGWLEKEGYPYTIYRLPPEEVERWGAVGGKPVWDKWLADCKAKGLPGQEVLDETIRLLGELKNPFTGLRTEWVHDLEARKVSGKQALDEAIRLLPLAP